MQHITCEADLFTKKTSVEDLTPDYRAYRKNFASAADWGAANKFCAYLVFYGIPLEGDKDQYVADFVAAAIKNGKPFYKDRIEQLRALNLEFEGGPVLALSAPKGRPAPRQEQFAALDEALQEDFLAMRKCALMTADVDSYEARQRHVLRIFDLVEHLDFKIERLATLWSDPVLKALNAAAYGVEGVDDWKESKTAVKMRYDFLLFGRQFAERVADDKALVVRLDTLIGACGAPKGRNMPEKIRAGAKQFEVLNFTTDLKDLAVRSMTAFHMSPANAGHAAAVSAGNMLLQLASGQRAKRVVTTSDFAGAARQIPDTEIVRPLLVFTKIKKVDGECETETILVEEAMLEKSRRAFDSFYLGFIAKFGRAPLSLNEQEDGGRRSVSAYSNDLPKLGRCINVELSSDIVRVGVPVALKRAGFSDREIARALGISQDVNFHAAFREVLNSGIRQDFADGMEKKGQLKDRVAHK